VTKLVLLASMVMMIVLPIRAGRHSNHRVGLKRAIAGPMVFNLLWAAVVVTAVFILLKNPALLFPESVNR
jgi:hypothetical protein